MKAVIFDLDGVLVDAKNIHYLALNIALGEEYSISWDEHLSVYDGLKTMQKLEMLTSKKGLPVELYREIWEKKQEYTLQELRKLEPSSQLIDLFRFLKEENISIGVCSNSIRRTVLTVLSKLDIIEYVDIILSNEDVANSKPHPEMYWTAMSNLKVLPKETLIVEDSPHGLMAASRAKAHVLRVDTPLDVNLENVTLKLKELEYSGMFDSPKWKDSKLNVLIPMAGAGSRFSKAGYTFPKPLIEVKGKPMIQVVVENLNIDANFIYVVQKSHREQYNLDTMLNLITPNCQIIEVEGLTEGAACTALLAKDHINNEHPLFFANSDQFTEWDSNEFFYKMNETGVDGGIVSFRATHPKWSFAKLDSQGFVEQVAEKNPISDIATVGYYYWKKGADFVKYAEKMIADEKRINNEFYVCPVYNEAIEDGKKISTFDIKRMWGIGTPEDLNYFLEHFKGHF